MYLALVFGGQYLLAGFFGKDNAVVLVVSALIVASLAIPLRRRIQYLMDRRFYCGKYDAARVVARFGDTPRHEVNLEQLCEQLLAVVRERMNMPLLQAGTLPPAAAEGEEKSCHSLPLYRSQQHDMQALAVFIDTYKEALVAREGEFTWFNGCVSSIWSLPGSFLWPFSSRCCSLASASLPVNPTGTRISSSATRSASCPSSWSFWDTWDDSLAGRSFSPGSPWEPTWSRQRSLQ